MYTETFIEKQIQLTKERIKNLEQSIKDIPDMKNVFEQLILNDNIYIENIISKYLLSGCVGLNPQPLNN